MENNTSQLNDLITYIDGVRQKMETVVSETDPKKEVCPGWTIKDAIGHITAWEIVIQKAIQAFVADDPPYFLREQDFDQFNEQAVGYRAAWPLKQVLQEWREVRLGLRKTIQSLDSALLGQELVLPWGSERTLAELIEILGEHEGEHMENVIKVTR